MAFSEGQIERLRARLNAYRAHEGQGGRARPWKSVLDDILMAETTSHEYPADGSLPEFKEEALRRFAAGTSILTDDKLGDLRVFLIEKGYLEEAELEEGEWSFASALALSALFGTAAETAPFLGAFAGTYSAALAAERGGSNSTTHYDLTIEKTEGEPVLKLRQEWFTWLYDRPLTDELRARYARQIRSRTGFGVGAPESGLIFAFKDGYTGRVEFAAVTAVDAEASRGNQVSWFASVSMPTEMQALTSMPARPEPLPRTTLIYETNDATADAQPEAIRAEG